jgi:phosphoglycerate kinase
MSPSKTEEFSISTVSKVTHSNYPGTIPTLQNLVSHNPRSIVLLSHLGRPNGQRNQKYSLRPVV